MVVKASGTSEKVMGKPLPEEAGVRPGPEGRVAGSQGAMPRESRSHPGAAGAQAESPVRAGAQGGRAAAGGPVPGRRLVAGTPQATARHLH